MPFEFIPLDIPAVILVRATRFWMIAGFLWKRTGARTLPRMALRSPLCKTITRGPCAGCCAGCTIRKTRTRRARSFRCSTAKCTMLPLICAEDRPRTGSGSGCGSPMRGPNCCTCRRGLHTAFGVLSEVADFTYKCTDIYAPETYRGIAWDDPDLGIPWPVKNPILSQRDQNLPRFKDADNNFIFRGP